MVRTRAGHDVVYTEASYGRAARTESRRRMQKRKFERQDQGGESGTAASTPQNARRTRARPDSAGRIGYFSQCNCPSRSYPTESKRENAKRKAPNMLRLWHFPAFFLQPEPDRSKQCYRSSKMLACTANHTSFSHPTTFRKDYCRRGAIMSIVTSNPDTDGIGSPSTGAHRQR